MTGSGYVYDQSFAEERERLAGMASLWDPGTQALLAELGVGGRALEIGGGAGTMVSWLGEHCEHVLVTDIDTRFLEPLASETVEVRRHDVRTDALDEAAFDLIHARLVLEHLPERREILSKLVAALRPGGTIVIEDYDWSSFAFLGVEDMPDVTDALFGFMAEAGFETNYGRRVVDDLVDCGLQARGEARARVIEPSHPGFAFFRLSFEALRPQLVATGRLTQERADEAAAAIARTTRLITPLMIAGIGSKP